MPSQIEGVNIIEPRDKEVNQLAKAHPSASFPLMLLYIVSNPFCRQGMISASVQVDILDQALPVADGRAL